MEGEILIQRPNPHIPWGFRIIGGSDSHIPIIISKVLENSIAEEAGLREDLLVEKINNIPISGLTHAEVNEIIVAAERELLFSVRRENLEHLILASLNMNRNSQEITETISEQELKKEFGQIIMMDNLDRIQQPSQEEKTQFSTLQGQTADRKWSTFLQKPRNPKPKIKGQASSFPKTEQYRVIIKKQKKKEPTIKPPSDDTNINEDVEPDFIEESKDTSEVVAESNEAEEYLEEGPKDTTDLIEDNEKLAENTEIFPNQCNPTSNDVIDEGNEEDQDNPAQEADVNESENTTQPSLEEQLVAVQKQLQELAALPSAIQETLSEVTQQLASIVCERKPEVNTEEAKPTEEDAVVPGLTSNEKEEIVAEDEQKVVDYGAGDSETAEMEDQPSDILSDICEEEEILEMIKENEQLEEELEQEEKAVNQQMDNQRTQKDEEIGPKGPVVRPIILPGGRKWVDPDDAETKIKNPKMTDDKICNTIETYSEVIFGKTKGINFLKYTPPSKNLDHLQRSEVYRLIHGMEPPIRGISIRSEKILAEQDYYPSSEN